MAAGEPHPRRIDALKLGKVGAKRSQLIVPRLRIDEAPGRRLTINSAQRLARGLHLLADLPQIAIERHAFFKQRAQARQIGIRRLGGGQRVECRKAETAGGLGQALVEGIDLLADTGDILARVQIGALLGEGREDTVAFCQTASSTVMAATSSSRRRISASAAR